jgi:hypothetical protein|tara:strand:- start:235 stop:522 length:288 start_codon:yes stop_codon:yes gene_type:complete
MIKIKDKEYKFKLGFKALLMFEKETGTSAANLGEDVKMSTLVDLCYCGLISCGEKVTKDFIIDAIDEDMGLLTTITDAMQQDVSSVTAIAEEAKK